MAENGGVRSDSAKRRVGASAAAYSAMNADKMRRPAQDNSFTESLIERLGTPEMLINELKIVKKDNETLQN